MKSGWRSKVTIRQGDITDRDTDAIVNAANSDLVLGAGVAGAIRRKGGPSIQAECDGIGPIPLGDAAMTGGGNLKTRHVIHAASMRLGGTTSEANLCSSTRKSLAIANEKGLKSIAFPAIGTGIAGFPLDRCAEVMLAEVRDHFSAATSLGRVEFVLFDDAAREAFERVLKSMND